MLSTQEEINQIDLRETSSTFKGEQEEKTFDCDICDDKQEFKWYHKGINDEDIKEERKNAKPHCKECNQVIPFHLLRGYFYRIIESEAIFKLLITGKGTGKSMNLALFQAWYITYHKEGHFVWVYRREDDLLKKGKASWIKAIKILQKKHEQGIISKFDIKDWKGERSETVSGKGVKFKGEMRVFFVTLQYADDTDSSFSGDALHYVFDEAMDSKGRYLKNEEGEWAQIFDNVAREGKIPTICFFLSNPHTKGTWWVEKYTKPEWLEEAFGNDGEKHYYEGLVDIQMVDGSQEKFFCSLYQAPAERGKHGRALDTVKNPRRHKTGTYEEEANNYINLRQPKKWKQLYLVKDCIYARELKQRKEIHQHFWYKKGEEEELDKDILHLCFSVEEFSASSCKRKKLIEDSYERDYWIKERFLYGLIKKKTLPVFFTGSNETQAHQAKNIIMGLINANVKNFDKS